MANETEKTAVTTENGRKFLWSFQPKSGKDAGESIVRNFLLHWFPAKSAERSLSWGYSFYLGTITFALFLILVVTGVVLMFLYVPSVERAYQSVKDIENVVSFGWFIRAMHRNATHLMVIFVFLHMVRVFLGGAYKNGLGGGQLRPINWIIGVVLLLTTLFLAFTGYLLPWDQLAFWAVTVGTDIARTIPLIGDEVRFILIGGHEIDQNTLIRFYVLHCFFLPLLMVGLIVYHFWRIRKDGGLASYDTIVNKQEKIKESNGGGKKTYSLLGITKGRTVEVESTTRNEDAHTVNSIPHLIRRVGLVILATFVFVAVMSLFMPAPLEEAANPDVTPNPAKAPWYFLWLQELVTITTFTLFGITFDGGFIGGVLIPGVLLIALCVWPFYDKSSKDATGVWFAKERLRQNLVFIVICFAIILLTIIGTYFRGPFWEFYLPWEAWPDLPRIL